LAYSERFNEIPVDHWRSVMAVNLDAIFFLTRYVAERMIASGIKGRIINISSANGFCAEAGHAHYNASKGALELLTQTFAIELGEHGITANTVCPEIIETESKDRMTIERLVDESCYCSENPMWHPSEKQLYWTYIDRGQLHRFNPKDCTYNRGEEHEQRGSQARSRHPRSRLGR
jgi:NAD(P)-dependent dehydrogenase (short-subunit alcohol dehydrogenase family)